MSGSWAERVQTEWEKLQDLVRKQFSRPFAENELSIELTGFHERASAAARRWHVPEATSNEYRSTLNKLKHSALEMSDEPPELRALQPVQIESNVPLPLIPPQPQETVENFVPLVVHQLHSIGTIHAAKAIESQAFIRQMKQEYPDNEAVQQQIIAYGELATFSSQLSADAFALSRRWDLLGNALYNIVSEKIIPTEQKEHAAEQLSKMESLTKQTQLILARRIIYLHGLIHHFIGEDANEREKHTVEGNITDTDLLRKGIKQWCVAMNHACEMAHSMGKKTHEI